MRLIRTFSILAGLSLAAVMGVAAGGAHELHGSGSEHTAAMDRMLTRIGVTAVQREQLEEAHQRQASVSERIHGVMAEAHERIAKLIHGDVFDERAIRDAAAVYADAQADMFVSRGELNGEMRRILTPDQLEQMRDLHHVREMGEMHERQEMHGDSDSGHGDHPHGHDGD